MSRILQILTLATTNLDLFTLKDGTDKLSRNTGKELPLHAA
jgi:hypothetical protein